MRFGLDSALRPEKDCSELGSTTSAAKPGKSTQETLWFDQQRSLKLLASASISEVMLDERACGQGKSFHSAWQTWNQFFVNLVVL